MEYQADDQPDAKERPELRLRRLWLSRLDREEKEHKAYREQAKKAREHYRQQKKGSDSESVKYPIFWSSVNALHASVFAQMPSADIRRRWRHSRMNLISLLPALTELRVYDNSVDGDPKAGQTPRPSLVLHVVDTQIAAPPDLTCVPDWARPIAAAAMKLALGSGQQ